MKQGILELHFQLKSFHRKIFRFITTFIKDPARANINFFFTDLDVDQRDFYKYFCFYFLLPLYINALKCQLQSVAT